jgi:hypothetical protein
VRTEVALVDVQRLRIAVVHALDLGARGAVEAHRAVRIGLAVAVTRDVRRRAAVEVRRVGIADVPHDGWRCVAVGRRAAARRRLAGHLAGIVDGIVVVRFGRAGALGSGSARRHIDAVVGGAIVLRRTARDERQCARDGRPSKVDP